MAYVVVTDIGCDVCGAWGISKRKWKLTFNLIKRRLNKMGEIRVRNRIWDLKVYP